MSDRDISKLNKTNMTPKITQSGDFIAYMSHEIRTPLNGIVATTNLIRRLVMDRKLSDDALMNYLRMIQHSSDAMLSLISDNLDLSKIESGDIAFARDPFSLRELLKSIRDIFKTQMQERNIAFDVCVEGDDKIPDIFIGDAPRLRQIWVNFIGNSLKYTRDGGIELRIKPLDIAPDYIQFHVCVKDTGAGIPLEDQPFVFGKFYQAAGKRDQDTAALGNHDDGRSPGAGLGLFICESFVKAMGGEIGFHSYPNIGTTFWMKITLPLSDQDIIRTGGWDAASKDLISFAGKTALLVEDVDVSRIVLSDTLEHLGFNIVAVQSAQDAIDLIAEDDSDSAYDIIFMDLHMPGLNGDKAAAQIRRDIGGWYADVPILALTGDVTRETREACKRSGMNDFLSKPFDPDELIWVISKWVDGSRKLPGQDQFLESGISNRPDYFETRDNMGENTHKNTGENISENSNKNAADNTTKTALEIMIADAIGEADETIFDPAFLTALFKRNPDNAKKFIAMTINEIDTRINAITSHARAGEDEPCWDAAHAMKSVSAQAGAMALSNRARAVENIIKTIGLKRIDIDELCINITTIAEDSKSAIQSFADNQE